MKQTTAEERTRRKRRTYSAKEKSQAVLALWSGRRNTAAVMKELEVPCGVLNGWEKRAINGILTALDPMWKQPEEGALKLPSRLERLMEETLRPVAATDAAVAN